MSLRLDDVCASSLNVGHCVEQSPFPGWRSKAPCKVAVLACGEHKDACDMGRYYGKPGYGHWFHKARKGGRKRKKYVPAKPTGKASILTSEQFDLAEKMALSRSFYPTRDRLFIRLSRYCGLRAKEIATLWVEDVTDVEGTLIGQISVSKRGAKYGKERTVGMVPAVLDALRDYLEETGITEGPIFWSHRRVPLTSNAVQKQLRAIYRACGFEGARSHSGRRSVITMLARNLDKFGGTMDDVRLFAGHAYIETTAEYIEPNPEAAARLVDLMRSR